MYCCTGIDRFSRRGNRHPAEEFDSTEGHRAPRVSFESTREVIPPKFSLHLLSVVVLQAALDDRKQSGWVTDITECLQAVIGSDFSDFFLARLFMFRSRKGFHGRSQMRDHPTAFTGGISCTMKDDDQYSTLKYHT